MDAAIRTAAANRQSVLLLVAHAPRWAEGPGRPSYVGPGAWLPDPKALAAFAHALAIRYSGQFPDPLNPGGHLPRVREYQAWNEPNLPTYLMPQWVRGAHGAIVAESPVIYRSMLNAFYAAIKQVQPHAFVLAAGTAPFGDPAGANRMAPVVFLRAMFCLTAQLRSAPCSDLPHFDGLDHHAYGYTSSPLDKAAQPDDVSVPDLGKILRVLHAAQRLGHALPAGPKSLWVTEFAASSAPVNPSALSLAVQARYLSLALYEFWHQGVSHAYWFQLSDPVLPQLFEPGGGLFFRSGVAKPAATAFRFPFVALPWQPHKTFLILWGRSPAAGIVEIEKRVGPGWRQILSLRTTAGGIFYATRRLSHRLVLRARIGADASLGWSNPK